MAQHNEQIAELFDELDSVEYSPLSGVQGVMGRLDRIFWKLEREGFPMLNDHRIGALMRALPERARTVAQEIWGQYACRVAYPELCRRLLQHEFPEDLGESGSESEDEEEDPEILEYYESEEDPEPEEGFEDAPEGNEDVEMVILEEGEVDEDLEIEDPDDDMAETVEDPDEIPEYLAPIVPVPPQDDLVMTLQLWLLFTIMTLYVLVGRVAPPN